ncbi:MAG: FHIPEP family type III secretion protein [Candidatus Gastranaerophilaceae bacterium]
MITIQVPYHYIDTLYAISIIALFLFGSMGVKLLQLSRENKKLKMICKNQQEYLHRMNPNKNLNYFGVDILKIGLSEKLKNVTEELMPLFTKLRTKLSFKLGYVIPNIRVFDDKGLKEDEYQIFVRNNLVGKFTISNMDNKANEIIENLENACLENISKIFMQENVQRLMDAVKNKEIVENIKENLSVEDVRLILIELMKQGISIKDIDYLLERISVYGNLPTLSDILESIKKDLK